MIWFLDYLLKVFGFMFFLWTNCLVNEGNLDYLITDCTSKANQT